MTSSSSSSNDMHDMHDILRIGPHRRVTLHFTLRLTNGEVVDTTRERKPASFVVGDESFLPGFEKALLGLKAGDRRSVLVTAKDGFGEHRADNIQQMARTLFASDVELVRGLVLSFADKAGELPGVVTAFDDDTVHVDFNHPLAGRDLTFEVEILTVEYWAPAQNVTLRNAAAPVNSATGGAT